MKENEVMIGDWFRFRYTIDGKEIVHTFRISRIEDELGDYYVWGDGFGRMCYPKRLEPIPITPEILEKNGFEDVGDGIVQFFERPFYVWFLSAQYELGIEREETSSLEELGTKRILDMPCIYVHELQHALRLAGIDKEIII